MPGLIPHPHRKWIYSAPPETANMKQDMCAEFDDALAKLIEATDYFQQAGFQIEYLRDNIDELRADDPDRHNISVRTSQALRSRIELGDGKLLAEVMDLNETLCDIRSALVAGTRKLANPDLEDVPDNDEPVATPYTRDEYPSADGEDSGS